MRTRIAISLVVGVGVITSLPVTAAAQLSDSGNAAQVQYPDMPTREPEPEAPAEAPAPAPAPAPAAAEESDLPMTGFVAIPLLITGALLLLTGGVMHVRTRDR